MFINKIILSKSGDFITEKHSISLPVQAKWLHQFFAFSGNRRTIWVEHISPRLRACRKSACRMSTCGFQPFSSPNVFFSETVQLLEIKHTEQCQSAQHQAGSNLRYTSQHRSEPVCHWILAMHMSWEKLSGCTETWRESEGCLMFPLQISRKIFRIFFFSYLVYFVWSRISLYRLQLADYIGRLA